MPQEFSPCRYCDKPVIWTKTARGKNMPVDLEPHPDGAFELSEVEDKDSGKIVNRATWVKPDEKAQGGEYYISHFKTCTQRPKDDNSGFRAPQDTGADPF